MKILQINNYHYYMGGSETVYLETSKLLKRFGHDVVHFSVKDEKTLSNGNLEFFVNPVKYDDSSLLGKIKNACKFVYSYEAKQKLQLLIEKEKPDIVHLHIFYGRLTSAILPIIKKNNIPVVMTLHEYKMICPVYLFLDSKNNICEKCAGKKYFYCILNKCNKNNLLFSVLSASESYFRDIFIPYASYVDMFIAVSKFSYNKHIEYKPEIASKIKHIYNFVDLTRYKKSANYSGNYYLYFGRLSDEKGTKILVEAFKELKGVKLYIAGEGHQMQELLSLISEYSLDNIVLTGFLSGKELEKIICNSKFTIVPSECYENNPLSLMESFAYGRPVIGARIGGIPELVKDGDNGFLFESRNKSSLIEAVKKAESVTKECYVQMSDNARKYVKENFDSNDHYNKLNSIYESLYNGID
jgi:glycosyltransferase involved in cell wall biosynthesis